MQMLLVWGSQVLESNPDLGSKTELQLGTYTKRQETLCPASKSPLDCGGGGLKHVKFASNSDITLPQTYYFLTYVSNVSTMR